MSRLKRVIKRLGFGLAILIAVALILNGAYSWHTGRQLEQRLAALRAAEEPITFADLAPKPIPPEQDAAAHLHRLAPRLKAFEKEYVEFLNRTPLGKSFGEHEDQGKPPTSDQIAAVREILSHYPELPQALDEASRCERYASRIDYTVADSLVLEEIMSTASSRRTPARFLRWKVTALLADGKHDEALRMGITILRIARHYDGEPALVNGLVACAVRGSAIDILNLVLRSKPLSAEVRQQLDHELALHDDPTWIQHVMKTERVINLSASRAMFSQAWWMPWYGRGAEIDIIDFHQRLLPALAQPWYKARDDIRNINTGVSSYSNPVSGALLTLLLPGIESAGVGFNRTTAIVRCLRILNKLTAYAQDNGHEAEGLDDVDLPAVAKIDPFSGEPLRLKWTDEGWVVYTIYSNGTDDDGNFKDQADWGLGPIGAPRNP